MPEKGKIPLWEGKTPPLFAPPSDRRLPSLELYLLQTGEAPRKAVGAVIVCAGGAYQFRCDHEAYPIAEWLRSCGVNAFVLNYRVAPYKAPCMQEDLHRAVRFVRANAGKWNIDPEKIGVIGFSAGGHLAASGCTLRETGIECGDALDAVSCHLNAGMFCYPVITMGEGCHEGSRKALLGDELPPEKLDRYSLERQIGDFTPPCFLFHTMEDDVVPAFPNSVAFAAAMHKAGRPCELHLFEHGGHGWSSGEGEAGQWRQLCESFLRRHGFMKAGEENA